MELKRIEKDLLSILEHLEKQKEERLKADEPKKTGITEDDRRAGMEFLKSPDLFKQIVEDMTALGYVGEDLNKELLYICASSRILDDPISILIRRRKVEACGNGGKAFTAGGCCSHNLAVRSGFKLCGGLPA
jgi:hypothetical protein